MTTMQYLADRNLLFSIGAGARTHREMLDAVGIDPDDWSATFQAWVEGTKRDHPGDMTAVLFETAFGFFELGIQLGLDRALEHAAQARLEEAA